MVRDPLSENIKINVYLKNGDSFIGKDITSNPVGSKERVVSFWLDNDTIRVYPVDEVRYFEYVFED